GESLRFAASTVLGRNPALVNLLPGCSEPALATSSQRPGTAPQGHRRCSRTTTAATTSPQPPAKTTSCSWQVCQNYHQDSEAAINRQINLELYASCMYLSVSYYFDCDDVALKNFAGYFLHQSPEEREHLKN
uniref:Ferritin n=1 Tax=Sus scrofa TaxID=9823 RepID=A0A8D0NPU6_PIG